MPHKTKRTNKVLAIIAAFQTLVILSLVGTYNLEDSTVKASLSEAYEFAKEISGHFTNSVESLEPVVSADLNKENLILISEGEEKASEPVVGPICGQVIKDEEGTVVKKGCGCKK